MRNSKKRRISTERAKIMRITMREKYYRMNANWYTNKNTMPRKMILMNTCISKKRRTHMKKNENLGTKKMTMATIITKNTKTRRKSGTRFLKGISLRTLYCPYIYPPKLGYPSESHGNWIRSFTFGAILSMGGKRNKSLWV